MFYGILATFAITLFKNYALIFLAESVYKENPKICDHIKYLPTPKYPFEFHQYIMTTTAVETGHSWFIEKYLILSSGNQSAYFELLFLIPTVFCFDIFSDFFYYWAHRLLHHGSIYIHIHKRHHSFHHPTSMITFYQHPLDVFLSNSIPTICAVYCIPTIQPLTFHIILFYKTYMDILAHMGKYTNQKDVWWIPFQWIPNQLGIQSFTIHHDLHHSLYKYNYGSRTLLWDIVFDTYNPKCMLNV